MKPITVFICCLLLFRSYSHAEKIFLKTSADNTFFIVDSWISGFTYGLCTNKEHRFGNACKRANRTAANDLRIWRGLFVSNHSRKVGGRVWETVSRFSWQLPQTVIGFGYAHFENTIGGNVDTVRYYHGATVLTGRHGLFFKLGGPAVTLGSYIVGSSGLHANANNYILQHEYGHYLQSLATGVAYFGRIAIPNIRSEHGDYQQLYSSHDFHPTEQDANRRAFLYFNHTFSDFKNDTLYTSDLSVNNKGWDFKRNPLFGCGITVESGNTVFSYVDADNAEHLQSLEQLRVSALWYDYVFPVISGFYNAYRYNHIRHTANHPR